MKEADISTIFWGIIVIQFLIIAWGLIVKLAISTAKNEIIAAIRQQERK